MSIRVNGKEYEISEKKKLLAILQDLGISIPTFCYDRRIMERHEHCGMCVVELNGELKRSCEIDAAGGMIIQTHSDRIIKIRREILKNLIEVHPLDCLGCGKSGECRLQDYCYEYDVPQANNSYKEVIPEDISNPFFILDPNKCIACGKCVAVCHELQCSNVLGLEEKNGKRVVAVKAECDINNTDLSHCTSCGNCVSICPVGALLPKSKIQFREWENKTVRTTCPYCGVGCQIDYDVRYNEIVGAKPANIAPNDGLLCVKGKFGYKFINHPDRLKTPLIRKNGKLEPVTYEEAYDFIEEKMKKIKSEFGPDAFAGLTSARCTNEDNYIFQKFFRAVIGTNNIDHCARL